MTYRAPTTNILAAAVDLSRGADAIGLARARLAFQQLADGEDDEIAEAVGLVLLGASKKENQRADKKGRVA